MDSVDEAADDTEGHGSADAEVPCDSAMLNPFADDVNGCFWKVLNPTERNFLQTYQQLAPSQVYQINQDPRVTATISDSNKMFTLIKNAGICWLLGAMYGMVVLISAAVKVSRFHQGWLVARSHDQSVTCIYCIRDICCCDPR